MSTINGSSTKKQAARLRSRSGSDPDRGAKPDKSTQSAIQSRICNNLKNLVFSNPDHKAIDDFLSDKANSDAFVEVKKEGNVRRRMKKTDNIFHHLVRGNQISDWTDDDLHKVLWWLFYGSNQPAEAGKTTTKFSRSFGTLLRQEMNRDETAMHYALNASNPQPHFVKVMLRDLKPLPSVIPEVLCMPLKPKKDDVRGEGRNCLHNAIDSESVYTQEVFDHMKVYFEKIRSEIWHPLRLQDPRDGNTPLHLAVMMAPCEQLEDLAGGTFAESKETRSQKGESSLNLIKQLVESYPEALKVTNKEGRTPYRERVLTLEEMMGEVESDTEGSNCTDPDLEFRRIVIRDPIAEFLRNYCIREMEEEHVMKCLYAQGEELAIDFTLAGLYRQSISEDYLQSFNPHLRFEATLKQVVLPKLTFSSKQPKAHRDSRLPMEIKGRTDFTNIFNWLRKQQVRKIFKVTVHDDTPPHHTDRAIVEYLKDFGVEIWDWKRVDLSSEVIRKASPEVREISLYCSGNQAVLNGWSSTGGFTDRTKFPKLERIMVYLREGQEDAATLRDYGNAFKNEILVGRKIRVDYKIDFYPYGMMSTGSRGTLDESEHQRITFLKNFATFFRNNLPGEEEEAVPSIKIAVLDDGLDPSVDMLKTGHTVIERGCAFFSSRASDRRQYYVPSGDHGARVTSLICSICPRTTLYIAKLSHEFTQHETTQISTLAAAKAVEWAVQCGVDIINMSWTIDSNMVSDELTTLQNAIEDAKKKGIVMFCSASDQGADSKICYPAHYKETITIGSLSATDTPSQFLQPSQVDFMLPGENILVQNNDGTTVKDSGSSLATAVATGMGGLLMYCTLLLKFGRTYSMRTGDLDPGKDSAEGYLTWDHELMHRIFTNLSGDKDNKLTRPDLICDILLKKLGGKRQDILHPEQNLESRMIEALKDIFMTRLNAESRYVS